MAAAIERAMMIAAADKAVRPPLKWAGGKRWLVPEIRKLWSRTGNRRIVEPLCGGLAVTLGLMPERAILNDINPHTINFYRALKRGLRIPKSLRIENDREVYYQNRARFNALVSAGDDAGDEAASLFYYLNRTCYNGLCRFNSRGEFNVPMGSYKKIHYVTDFEPYREVFSNWDFNYGDFEYLALEKDDFIYADPPYDVQFTKYSKEGFGWMDQERLAEWLARHRGPAVISNQATPRVVRLYRRLGFRLAFLDAPRMINCTGDRTPAREVLATKNF